MKRTFTLLTVAIVTLAMTSCGGGNNPKDVAKTFLKAMENQNWEDAKAVSTEKTGKMLDMMKGMSKMGNSDSSPTGKFKEIKGVEKDGKEATVKYCCDKNGKESEMTLKKKGGEWKVHMKKEQPGKGGSKGAGGSGGPGGSGGSK